MTAQLPLPGPQNRQKRLYRTSPPWVRLMRKRRVDENGCWIYTGFCDRDGYGYMREYGKAWKVHRWIYTRVIGPIPEGYQIDHLCKVTSCFNPFHLEAVTPRENTLRSDSLSAQNARRTHCRKGHPLTGTNLLIETGRTGGPQRRCRECKNTRQRRTSA
jgi:hypothetical protein